MWSPFGSNNDDIYDSNDYGDNGDVLVFSVLQMSVFLKHFSA